MLKHPEILERVIKSGQSGLSPELARYVLSLRFSAADKARYTTLAEQAQRTQLSSEEQSELEDFVALGDFLAMLHAQARAELLRHNSAA
jgi:hypothetical protein